MMQILVVIYLLLIPVSIFSESKSVSVSEDILRDGWEFYWKADLVKKNPSIHLSVGCVVELSLEREIQKVAHKPARFEAMPSRACQDTKLTDKGKELILSVNKHSSESNKLISEKFYRWDENTQDPISGENLSIYGYAVYRKTQNPNSMMIFHSPILNIPEMNLYGCSSMEKFQ